jgi:hypothetical protein
MGYLVTRSLDSLLDVAQSNYRPELRWAADYCGDAG